jgi:hypothetical protein
MIPCQAIDERVVCNVHVHRLARENRHCNVWDSARNHSFPADNDSCSIVGTTETENFDTLGRIFYSMQQMNRGTPISTTLTTVQAV